ncbi:MAG: cyclic nucleotide-binding domain-containing protein [Nitrospirae bacterium]|nr:cyclic nucleotide-binding domain-containing protein [Nitrospirota bacterium]
MNDLSRKEMIAFIESNMLFQNILCDECFDEDALNKAYDIISISSAKKDELIIKEWTRGESLILIFKGVAGVFIETDDGKEVKIATVEESGFWGEMYRVEGKNRTPIMKAETDCLFGIIYRYEFWEYFYIYPEIGRNVFWGANQNLDMSNIGIVRDIVKKSAENLSKVKDKLEKQIQEKTNQLRQDDIQNLEIDRMHSLGIIAAGIAHEINNPLSFIKSGVGFIEKMVSNLIKYGKHWKEQAIINISINKGADTIDEKTLDLDNLQRSIVKKISSMNRGIERISRIVNTLLYIVYLDIDPLVSADLNSNIDEVVNNLGTKYAKNIQLVKQLGKIPLLVCSSNEINHCLLQILTNAIDAIEGYGTITISTLYDEESKMIVIMITDNGKGMTNEVLKQVFIPFFTTKPVGSGAGLGMYITEGIVKRHGGTVDITSKPGEGTTVTLKFPISI